MIESSVECAVSVWDQRSQELFGSRAWRLSAEWKWSLCKWLCQEETRQAETADYVWQDHL